MQVFNIQPRLLLLLSYFLLFNSTAAQEAELPFTEFGCEWRNFTQALDHFNSAEQRAFTQRYVVCPGAWPTDAATQQRNGTIIFFLGNESPLSDPQQPIVFENARRLNSLVIALEHRYYGDSVPFPPSGTQSTNASSSSALPGPLLPTTAQYHWLCINQVMADSKAVLEAMRVQYDVPLAVPAVVIGGSYGGQLAAYHRVSFPTTFAAAVAASGPVDFVLTTPSFEENEQKFHDVIGRAVKLTTGDAVCASTVREALNFILASGEGVNALDQIGASMNICNASEVLTTPSDALSLVENIYYAWAGNAVQINGQGDGNEEFIVGACSQLAASLAENSTDLVKALGVATRWVSKISSEDCYPFDNTYIAITNPANADPSTAAYMYQCCTQGTVDQTMMASSGAAGTLLPRFQLPLALVQEECRKAFGPYLPEMAPATVAANFRAMLADVGGVVFTQGDRDGWSGGGINAPIPGVERMAVVIYPNASHCTDTHNFNWDNAAEPAVYAELRAKAMDYAAVWMEAARAAGEGEATCSGSTLRSWTRGLGLAVPMTIYSLISIA